MCLYRLDDGTSLRGPGFPSLLGALYLQTSNFREAPTEVIAFCECVMMCSPLSRVNLRGATLHWVPAASPRPTVTTGSEKRRISREFCVFASESTGDSS